MVKNKYLTTLIIFSVFLLSITVTASAFQVKLNDRGRDVIEVQKYLETLGYNISADGIFGKSTEDAVKDFQSKNNVQVDGIVGSQTYQLIQDMISEKVSYELYVVDNGDTLSGIANSRDVSLEEIMEYNNLSSARITPGQDLKIPRDDIMTVENNKQETEVENEEKSQVYYTVKQGDTLSTIAARRSIPVEEIMDANNLNSDFIKKGQELVLPISNYREKNNVADAENSNISETKENEESSSETEKVVHTVQRGEALSTIARTYGTDIDSIRSNNNINGDRIFAGDDLVISNPQRGPFRLENNSLIWPVNGRITSGFGWRNHPVKNTRLFHNGLDIAVPTGTPVNAAAAGEVVHSGWMNGFGYTVIIDHGQGVETLYGHNSRVVVSRGTTVSRGQRIALSGSTGVSTGPHLHFGVLRNDEPLNPKNYLP